MRIFFLIPFLIIILVTSGYPALHQLTTDGEDYYPCWSPDGTQIAFQREVMGTGGNLDIYVKNADGTGTATRITYNSAADYNSCFSTTGNSITFTSNRSPVGIWSHDLTNDTETVLVEGAYCISWSPDGRSIAYSKFVNGDLELFKNDLQTGIETQLTFTPGQDAMPDWSPDGQSIIYNHGDIDPSMWIIPAIGGTSTQVPVAYGYRPSWSKDGSKICFDAGILTSGVFIYIYDFTTSQLANTHVEGMNPDWSPVGDKIAYQYNSDIYYMDYPLVLEPSTLGKIKAMYK